jgi:hypothetical protein
MKQPVKRATLLEEVLAHFMEAEDIPCNLRVSVIRFVAFMPLRCSLANRAGGLRENRIGVGPYQSKSPDHDNQNYGHHHSVFGDVLAILRREKHRRLAHSGPHHLTTSAFYAPFHDCKAICDRWKNELRPCCFARMMLVTKFAAPTWARLKAEQDNHELKNQNSPWHTHSHGHVFAYLCTSKRKCNARCSIGAVSDNCWSMGNLCFALRKTKMKGRALGWFNGSHG